MKLTESELKRVVELQINLQEKYPEWREGQSFFNALNLLVPEVANEIRGTEYDPYHVNNRLVKCMEYIASNEEVND